MNYFSLSQEKNMEKERLIELLNDEHVKREILKIVKEGIVQKNEKQSIGKARIEHILKKMGFSTKLKGYRYLVTAIELTMYETKISRVGATKSGGLYDKVAEKHETNSLCVARDIRFAIENAWRQKNPLMKKIFGEKMPNSIKFIYAVMEYIYDNF